MIEVFVKTNPYIQNTENKSSKKEKNLQQDLLLEAKYVYRVNNREGNRKQKRIEKSAEGI